MKKIKVLMFFVIFLVMEIFATLISFVTLILAQIKISEFNADQIIKDYMKLLKSPVSSIKTLIEQRNPVFIICTVAAVVISIYYLIINRGKNSYDVENKYGVHGSSRFANKKEIFKENEIISVSKGKIRQDLLDSIKSKGNNYDN